ncbi:NAD(P)/FAD-dependent oxidoreductase [Roseomonas sp. CECT 9278]|uniref:NAD(P)/FAD-dependent oxidoreductase n=1 Tax=Roseomonas sp. CECT 9278 TaxID=2845823 RepID=UPI001E3BD4E4|nr:NAD(P)/FAD-dependent oxidoreductase [Roseomonas sp. CECT 9278]CAH0276847.1 Hydrogen cyanide synthase subunit HcnB [Roseomonas sp. CECT 9278]
MIHDLAIIGAGPAGMAAAVEARACGLSVLVVDDNPAPGGQVFRAAEAAAPDPAVGPEIAPGLALIAAFRASGAEYRPATTLWHLDPDEGLLSLAGPQGVDEARARRVLLATGAQERAVPIPGWTLPGVMTAGAAQIMLKTTGAVPAGRTVLAGQGPLVWLLAVQLARAGAAPLLLETRSTGLAAALSQGGLWSGRRLLAKGLALMAEARRRGVRVVRPVRGLRAEGTTRVERIAWDGGAAPCDTLLLHEGVIPQTHVSRAIGVDHAWDAGQACWRPVTDGFGASSHDRIAIAGDGAGIGGWEAAVAAGRLAALDTARRLDALDAAGVAARSAAPLAARRAALALRPLLDAFYAPPASVLAPPDDVLACRCEEVTAGAIRAAARLGATGPNQMKAYLRCGMGPCQGRICAPSVAALIAEVRGVPPETIAPLRPRAPYKPITVGQLAASAESAQQPPQ